MCVIATSPRPLVGCVTWIGGGNQATFSATVEPVKRATRIAAGLPEGAVTLKTFASTTSLFPLSGDEYLLENGSLMYGGANILSSIEVDNGWIHVLDAVRAHPAFLSASTADDGASKDPSKDQQRQRPRLGNGNGLPVAELDELSKSWTTERRRR